MRRTLLLALLSTLLLLPQFAWGQENTRLEPGDPPRASLIAVSAPDAQGIVSINGDQNSVFPTAQLVIRNLYTGETVYTQAGINGTFSVRLYGPGNTPFLISPLQGTVPNALRDRPGSVPGGPAVIITGSAPSATPEEVAFSLDGALGSDARWHANGTIARLAYDVSDPNPITLSLNVRMPQPQDSAITPDNLRFIGRLELLPIAIADGGTMHVVGGLNSNNGWSGVLTPSGLPIDDLSAPIVIADATAEGGEIAEIVDGLAFTLNFERRLPSNLLPGVYVPVLRGYVRVGEAMPEPWETTAIFGQGASTARSPLTRLPVVLNVGAVDDIPLPWALLMNTTSDGSRGVLPSDDSDNALSNRVRYNAPTYILPPNSADGAPLTYSLEPHLMMQLANAYNIAGAPLIPFALPGGSMSVSVEAPDGTMYTSGSLPILQNRVGTDTIDERTRFGTQQPLDTYQLTTFEPRLSRYSFSQYGEHVITLEGELQDVYGNTYVGGGEYHVLIAEPLDLTPAVLSGTPYEVGDALNAGLHITPGIPADVTVRVRVYPLDGSEPLETTYEGQANRGGYFHPSEPAVFDIPGEYVIDYEARYTDAQGRLWAGSLRSAGVIAGQSSAVIAHGARGLANLPNARRQAWYSAERVVTDAGLDVDAISVILNNPYHSGDVFWLPDGATHGLAPILRLQDLLGDYQTWLLAGRSTDAGALGVSVRDGAVIDELPAALLTENANYYDPAGDAPPANESYAYLSVVRPAVTMRQFITGAPLRVLPTWVDMDDPLNGQIGAGLAGAQPGDYFFVFGGAVLNQAENNLHTSAIYASSGVVIEDDDPQGARVAPPARGADGGADGGSLLTIDDTSYDAFFVPTGVQPGDVLTVGDTFALSGQIAPALPNTVQVRIISPNGHEREYTRRANAIGYFYDPEQDFVVNEVGVWTVDVQVIVDSQTSVGITQPPYPQGGVIGAAGGRFSVYVADALNELIERPTRSDVVIPAALPYNFNISIPEGWTDAHAYYSLTTPGYILEQDAIRLNGRSFSYQHNPTNINRQFPNIEVEGRTAGAAISDAQQLTFFIVGRDANGNLRTLYRVYTFFHDRLISLD